MRICCGRKIRSLPKICQSLIVESVQLIVYCELGLHAVFCSCMYITVCELSSAVVFYHTVGLFYHYHSLQCTNLADSGTNITFANVTLGFWMSTKWYLIP